MILSDLVTMRAALEKLSEGQYPFDVALKIAKFTREVLEEIQEFENKRMEYFKKYGEDVGEGNMQIPAKNEAKFKNAIKRSLNKKIKIKPLNAAELSAVVKPIDLLNCLQAFE